MSNTPSLLPCPFCGKTHSLIVGAASEAWDADEHGPYPHTESYAVFCDASTDGRSGGCGGAGGYRLTKDEAIEVWNRRTPQLENLGFTIENRAGADVLVWKEGGCRPATSAEVALWKALSAVQQPVVREPFCYVSVNKQGDITRTMKRKDKWTNIPLYTTPQPAQVQPVVRKPLTDEQIDNLIAAKHFREGYELTASDKVCINWYRLGLRDGESANGITQKGGSNGL